MPLRIGGCGQLRWATCPEIALSVIGLPNCPDNIFRFSIQNCSFSYLSGCRVLYPNRTLCFRYSRYSMYLTSTRTDSSQSLRQANFSAPTQVKPIASLLIVHLNASLKNDNAGSGAFARQRRSIRGQSDRARCFTTRTP